MVSKQARPKRYGSVLHSLPPPDSTSLRTTGLTSVCTPATRAGLQLLLFSSPLQMRSSSLTLLV
eukprot:4251210-Pleurochrysis_carterae.AAC.1